MHNSVMKYYKDSSHIIITFTTANTSNFIITVGVNFVIIDYIIIIVIIDIVIIRLKTTTFALVSYLHTLP